MFSDPRFLALGIRSVRYDMSWDALSVPYQRAEVTRLDGCREAHGLSVLVTIDHSDRVIYKKVKVHGKTKTERRSARRACCRRAAQYVSAFRAFRKRFPWVQEFATWDETNYYGEATYDKEALVASYYRGLRCGVPLVHDPRRRVPRHPRSSPGGVDDDLGRRVRQGRWATSPGYWGLNNYEDANHLQDHQHA